MSLTDLSVPLRAARRHPGWTSQLLKATLAGLVAALPGSVTDYDENAGEEWGRILLDDELVAILWGRGAFAMVNRDFADLVPQLATAGLVVEIVSDWDAPSYRIEPQDLRSLFGRETVTDAVNLAELSANELWWATT